MSIAGPGAASSTSSSGASAVTTPSPSTGPAARPAKPYIKPTLKDQGEEIAAPFVDACKGAFYSIVGAFRGACRLPKTAIEKVGESCRAIKEFVGAKKEHVLHGIHAMAESNLKDSIARLKNGRAPEEAILNELSRCGDVRAIAASLFGKVSETEAALLDQAKRDGKYTLQEEKIIEKAVLELSKQVCKEIINLARGLTRTEREGAVPVSADKLKRFQDAQAKLEEYIEKVKKWELDRLEKLPTASSTPAGTTSPTTGSVPGGTVPGTGSGPTTSTTSASTSGVAPGAVTPLPAMATSAVLAAGLAATALGGSSPSSTVPPASPTIVVAAPAAGSGTPVTSTPVVAASAHVVKDFNSLKEAFLNTGDSEALNRATVVETTFGMFDRIFKEACLRVLENPDPIAELRKVVKEGTQARKALIQELQGHTSSDVTLVHSVGDDILQRLKNSLGHA